MRRKLARLTKPVCSPDLAFLLSSLTDINIASGADRVKTFSEISIKTTKEVARTMYSFSTPVKSSIMYQIRAVYRSPGERLGKHIRKNRALTRI